MATVMKKVASVLAGSAMAMAVSTVAVAEDGGVSFSGNIGVVSDYKFRGLSQTDGDPAVQGGLDLEFGNGFYLGTWGSQVEFADAEVDVYGGYAADINDSVSYDVGYIYYAYPGSDGDVDYQEFYGSMDFGDLSLGLVYSNDLIDGDYFYPSVGYSFALPAEISLDLHLGSNQFSPDEGSSDNYLDYSVGVSKEFGGLALSASLVDTDINEAACEDICDLSLIVGATYTW